MEKEVKETKEVKVNLSQHSKERYAERIMDRDNKCDIRSFIAQNEEKIHTDIAKMVQYGTVIYTGKTNDDKRTVKVYRCDTWLVLLGVDNSTVITLFKVDLGVGVEFDRQYIDKYTDIINKLQYGANGVRESVERRTSDYQEIIKNSEEEIAEYKRCIKNLEALVASYKETVSSLNAEVYVAESEVRRAVNKLLGKKTF